MTHASDNSANPGAGRRRVIRTHFRTSRKSLSSFAPRKNALSRSKRCQCEYRWVMDCNLTGSRSLLGVCPNSGRARRARLLPSRRSEELQWICRLSRSFALPNRRQPGDSDRLLASRNSRKVFWFMPRSPLDVAPDARSLFAGDRLSREQGIARSSQIRACDRLTIAGTARVKLASVDQ